jgi:hypothetical protein
MSGGYYDESLLVCYMYRPANNRKHYTINRYFQNTKHTKKNKTNEKGAECRVLGLG